MRKNAEYSNENNFPGKQYVLFMFRLSGRKLKPKQDASSHESETQEAQRCRQKCTEMVSELADKFFGLFFVKNIKINPQPYFQSRKFLSLF